MGDITGYRIRMIEDVEGLPLQTKLFKVVYIYDGNVESTEFEGSLSDCWLFIQLVENEVLI